MHILDLSQDNESIGIACACSYLPGQALTVDELGDQLGLSQRRRDRFQRIQGLRVVRVAEGETPASMAVSAGAKLLSNYHIDPKTVDVVILYSTMMATSIEPRTLVGEVQHRLQLHRSLGFAVSGQNCASIITVLRMARDLLRSGTAETVLAIGVDSFVGSLRRDIQDISLMGEGASAALIRRGCPTNRLVALANVVEGAFYRTIACSTEEWERFNLLYFITANRLIRRTLDSVSLLLDDIALVVPHNINRASWARLCNQLRLPQEKFFDENIDRCGHICGSDLLINWSDVIAEGRLAKGDLALMVTVGLGAAWGCALIRH